MFHRHRGTVARMAEVNLQDCGEGLGYRLAKLRQEGVHTDTRLLAEQGGEVKAHWAVLARHPAWKGLRVRHVEGEVVVVLVGWSREEVEGWVEEAYTRGRGEEGVEKVEEGEEKYVLKEEDHNMEVIKGEDIFTSQLKQELLDDEPFDRKTSLADETIDKIICVDCGKNFEDRIRLAKHKEDAHSGRQFCTLCSLEFSMKSSLRRHMKEIHGNHEKVIMCKYCGKTMSREEGLRNHEQRCNVETIRKKRTIEKKFDCKYCEKKFSSRKAANLHNKIKHVVDLNTGYVIVNKEPTLEVKEFICKVCPVPKKFTTKSNLKTHMIIKHNGRKDQIKFGDSFINLTEEEIQNQESKVAMCEICEEQFSCDKDLRGHLKDVHNEVKISCKTCGKEFKNSQHLGSHVYSVHRTPSLMCPLCGKLQMSKFNLDKHMKSHQKILKPIASLKRRQQYNRLKKEGKNTKSFFKNTLFGASESVKKPLWDDCPYDIEKIKEAPVSEHENKDNNK